MTTGWSNRLRDIADREYVQAGRGSGIVRIRLGDLKEKAKKQGFPAGHTEQVATAIESKKFWGPRGLVMVNPKGQKRQVDTIFEFRALNTPAEKTKPDTSSLAARVSRDPLLALAGTLKHAFPEGAEAFLRDIRRDKEESF